MEAQELKEAWPPLRSPFNLGILANPKKKKI
jgi:hypothetical protein